MWSKNSLSSGADRPVDAALTGPALAAVPIVDRVPRPDRHRHSLESTIGGEPGVGFGGIVAEPFDIARDEPIEVRQEDKVVEHDVKDLVAERGKGFDILRAVSNLEVIVVLGVGDGSRNAIVPTEPDEERRAARALVRLEDHVIGDFLDEAMEVGEARKGIAPRAGRHVAEEAFQIAQEGSGGLDDVEHDMSEIVRAKALRLVVGSHALRAPRAFRSTVPPADRIQQHPLEPDVLHEMFVSNEAALQRKQQEPHEEMDKEEAGLD